MAGKKQHHLWQMLQRGFGEKVGNDYHTWVYTKGEPPRKTTTRNFGVEKFFYGSEGSTADQNISKYENENQGIIQEIRQLPNGANVDTEFAATLVAHLQIRTAFFREEFSTKAQKVIRGFVEHGLSLNKAKQLILHQLKSKPDILNDLFAKALVAPAQRPSYSELIYSFIEAMPEGGILSEIAPVKKMASEFAEHLPKTVREAHNKALSDADNFKLRVTSHSHLAYSALRPVSGSFILPDTTVAFLKKEGGASPVSQSEDVIEAIIVPISSKVAIIGTAALNRKYELKAINRVLAGCAYRSFLAESRSNYYQSLSSRIGKYAELISDQDLNRMVRE